MWLLSYIWQRFHILHIQLPWNLHGLYYPYHLNKSHQHSFTQLFLDWIPHPGIHSNNPEHNHFPWQYHYGWLFHNKTPLYPCCCPICTSVPKYQSPNTLPFQITSSSYHASLCTRRHCNPWTPPRIILMRLTLPEYIKWPRLFFRWLRIPHLPLQTRNCLRHPLYFWHWHLLVKQNLTRLCSPFGRHQDIHILLGQQNYPMSPTHT